MDAEMAEMAERERQGERAEMAEFDVWIVHAGSRGTWKILKLKRKRKLLRIPGCFARTAGVDVPRFINYVQVDWTYDFSGVWDQQAVASDT